jgi:hypothetical protein
MAHDAETHSTIPTNADKYGINNSPRMVAQRQQLRSLFGNAAQLPGDGAETDPPVQRVRREAKVTWAITHLVREQHDGPGPSLFGKGEDWRSGEVSPDELGQLSHDQMILVDDEAVFMSRRGGNQEDPSRRRQDAQTDELKHKWFKVLAVEADGRWVQAPKDAYVRAETVQLIGVKKPDLKKIGLVNHGPEAEKAVSTDLRGIHEAWQRAAEKRRRSIGRVNMEFDDQSTDQHDDITSGWNWDQFDEGVNVSADMQKPEDRTGFAKMPTAELVEQQVLSANYSETEPVAYMVLEVRKERDNEDEPFVPFMYIRWLIAHPEKGGGGSTLIKQAIQSFNAQSQCTELRVDSAFSAVGWYELMGFKKVDPTKDPVKRGVGYADTSLVYRKS